MKVLFVCTGNIFRSMSAQYCLKDYLKKHNIKGIQVASAGITAHKQEPLSMTVKTLNEYGIDPSNHVQRKIDAWMVEDYDIIIAMSKLHQNFIKQYFDKDVPLFNDIAINESTNVNDIEEAPETIHDVDTYVHALVKYIYEKTPIIAEYVQSKM